MKIDYFDRYLFEKVVVEVTDCFHGALGWLRLVKNKKIGEELKKVLAHDKYGFIESLDDIQEEEIEIFSKKSKEVMEKLNANRKIEVLSYADCVVLFADVIIPIAYNKAYINKNYFMHSSIIFSCRMLWGDMSLALKEQIWNLCNKTEFVDIELSEVERNEKVLFNYPEIKKYRLVANPGEVIHELLKFRTKLPKDVWAYVLRGFYKGNTHGLSIENFHEMFDGIKREELMNDRDLVAYNELPEEIIIYRGTKNNEHPYRLSWSLDKNVALKFAEGGYVFKAKIKKDRIIVYWDDFEKEVLAWVDDAERKSVYDF